MGRIVVDLFAIGRIARSICAGSSLEQQCRLTYFMFLQLGLAALCVGAALWLGLIHEGPAPSPSTQESTTRRREQQ